MKKWLALVATASVVIALLVVPSTTLTYEAPPQEPKPPRSKSEIIQLILDIAEKHGIDGEQFLETAKCESSLRPSVVGDGGESYGLFQIHIVSHPTVEPQQALDPVWATEWSAKKWAEGKASMWTCARLLYGTTNPKTP